ncbi:hypothetical protein CSUB01_12405 [Colletotrichum sublineola]|uniref:Uncharacterized protein n=1 Tax=Colletotrichum sublineola TaxID=1173701 RepID=A0A066WWJ3_COLSU|nr:hypothetical protein CSUB01_12405 [Colletotrichum sublineola]
MILQCLLVIFAAFSPLHSLVFAETIRPFMGNPAYSVDVERSGYEWTFEVFSDGYNKRDSDGSRSPLDYLVVDTVHKSLTVYTAMNGYDQATPRLKMRQVLKQCWTMTGLQPGDIREVKGAGITNTDMKAAMKECRRGLGLGRVNEFAVSATDRDAAKRNCWNRLGQTIFSASIRGAISDFGINKKLVSIQVTTSWRGDTVHYYFS